MKLAISNIAWHLHEEREIAAMLARLSVSGVEVAPTKIWPIPLQASAKQIREYRQFWEKQGIEIISLQALLYGKPELTIFGDTATRHKTFAYLCGMIDLATKLGAQVLVFGSPKNRRINDLSQVAAEQIAVPFFQQLGERANSCGIYFCLEPNPPEYSCDFITNATAGLQFVKQVGQPGFALHLDAAAMTLSNDSFDKILRQSQPWWRHFHISEPYLGQIGAGGVDHKAIATAIRDAGYDHWLSIEMRAQSEESCLKSVEQAIRFAIEQY